MKLKFFQISIAIISLLLLINCSSDDEASTGEWGVVQIKFENRFEDLSPIILNNTTQTSTNGQKHQFSTLKYIVSNFTLTNSNGVEYTFHLNDPDKGAFVVDQNNAVLNEVSFELDSIPAGFYTKIKFGLGISQDAYLLGGESQGEFWATAADEEMTWAWAAGYVFAKLEGKYGTDMLTNSFSNHTGNMGNVSENGTPNLYREVEFELPSAMEVSSQALPGVHFIADLNQFLSGETLIALDEFNDDAVGSSSAFGKCDK